MIPTITIDTLKSVGLTVDKPLLMGEFSHKLTAQGFRRDDIIDALKLLCVIRSDPQDRNILWFSLKPELVCDHQWVQNEYSQYRCAKCGAA